VVYGATEFAGGVAGWTIRDWRDFHETKRGSVGRVNPGVQVRVVDQETDRVVTDGSVGLLELKGAQLASEEWVRTTDLGRIDEDGFIWIVGRADDVIIRGGFKVPTGAVADVLRAHPDVVEACVVGRPDARLGQVPVAAVEVRSGAPLTAEELRSWASERLSGYQVPVEVRIVDQLPRTPSMKVSQHGVRAILDTPTG
jgi:acyl-CoA synthetase (AMP-forming)/AMP-acid ligase II